MEKKKKREIKKGVDGQWRAAYSDVEEGMLGEDTGEIIHGLTEKERRNSTVDQVNRER